MRGQLRGPQIQDGQRAGHHAGHQSTGFSAHSERRKEQVWMVIITSSVYVFKRILSLLNRGYRVGEVMNITCSSPNSLPSAKLKWYINSELVRKSQNKSQIKLET